MDILSTVFFVGVIIFSAIIHEYAHGWMANQLGDPTARLAGRLTLNPIAHLDLFGSVILPLLLIPTGMIFAYAKPVPYNAYNLSDQKWGAVKVAIAGPISNLILAFVFGVVLQLMPASSPMIPFLFIIVFANVLLAVFNMVPIPPLDGSKLLLAVLPDSAYQVLMMLERYGFVLLLLFIFVGFEYLRPIINGITTLFVGWL